MILGSHSISSSPQLLQDLIASFKHRPRIHKEVPIRQVLPLLTPNQEAAADTQSYSTPPPHPPTPACEKPTRRLRVSRRLHPIRHRKLPLQVMPILPSRISSTNLIQDAEESNRVLEDACHTVLLTEHLLRDDRHPLTKQRYHKTP
jgi:hypothetical protein